MIGKTISHYKILQKLGEGGMGTVYKAQDTKLDRFVALKFLAPHLSRAEDEKKRFIHEAKAASALDHPNICSIYEIDETEDRQMFIAMAYYEGESLKEKIEQGLLPIQESIDIAMQVAQGLARAHEEGIVHRDVKPANIMITNRDEVKIVDFGLAKLVGGSMLTIEGTTLGTVGYMSPEQTHGEKVDHRTDIWSQGVVLYEMISGQLPFKGDYEQAVVYSILNEDPRPVTDLRTEVPVELERIVKKAITKNTDDRYQHTDEMMVDLKSLGKELETGITKAWPITKKLSQRKRAFLYWSVTGILFLALIALFIFLPSKSGSVDKKTIAVLPFKNLSESGDSDYFSDGITEDILTQLSKIGDLRVISSLATKQYKYSDKSPQEIGQELNIATLLAGSIRRAGNQLRIACQLIDAVTEEQIWAETYDREMKDVFGIQSEVSQKIAKTLKAKLSPEERTRIEKKPTANLTAYEYYLKGREYYYRYKKQDNENAIKLFKNALELDGEYALAWAGLGDAYAQRPVRFGFAFSWLDSAIAVSKRALALDPNSAEAYKGLGTAYSYKGLDNKALQALHKAVELNPNYFPAVTSIGFIYNYIGAFDKALRWQKKSADLNPTHANSYLSVGDTYRILDDPVKAEEGFNKALKLQPDNYFAYFDLALLYLAQDKDQQAMDQIEKLLAIDSDDTRILEMVAQIAGYSGNFTQAKQFYQQSIANHASIDTDPYALSPIGLGHILWEAGQQHEAQKLLNLSRNLRQKLIEQGDEAYFSRYEIANIEAIQGNETETYKWLQKTIDAGWREYRLALRNPWLENLHDDEQFQEMMAQVKSVVDEMRERIEESDY